MCWSSPVRCRDARHWYSVHLPLTGCRRPFSSLSTAAPHFPLAGSAAYLQKILCCCKSLSYLDHLPDVNIFAPLCGHCGPPHLQPALHIQTGAVASPSRSRRPSTPKKALHVSEKSLFYSIVVDTTQRLQGPQIGLPNQTDVRALGTSLTPQRPSKASKASTALHQVDHT